MRRISLRSFVWLIAGLVLICQGEAVLAVDTSIGIAPDKAFYHPGETVSLAVSAAGGVKVEATIHYLSETVATLNAPLDNGTATLTWTPPNESKRGYGVNVEALDANGKVVATTSTAFDVLDDWLQAPRYGFLTNFSPGRSDIDTTMAMNAKYHVNGLQFYDWQYRHETLLPPASAIIDPTTQSYVDVLERTHSLITVKSLIAGAHARNIAAMPYTAIYGASYAFYNLHPDWALYTQSKQPYDFADFLKIMDPTPGSPWANHLLGEFADVLEHTDFDGIHIDQYGAPNRGLNAAGQDVNMETAFPGFINQAAALVKQMRGPDGATIFNLVRNWPVKTVAPSDENAVYIEVWDPYNNFMDLARIISQAQTLGSNKPVIIAAYISPEKHYVNAQIANAVIFASGAYHLELGEPDAMLEEAYFPRYGLMSAADSEIERRYYDFLVRYENVLALGTTDGTKDRAGALTIDGVTTVSFRSEDRVAVIVRKGEWTETFSLVNMMGIGDGQWNGGLTKAPTPLHNLAVRIRTTNLPVANIWLASPDGDKSEAQPVHFTQGSDTNGSYVDLIVPQLDYWTMLVVEYSV